MITSLEIDDPLARRLEAISKSRGMTLRALILEALQQVADSAGSTLPAGRFTQPTHDFGAHVETPWTILAELESEEHIRKYSKK